MKRLICDTNVFYNLGLGHLKVTDIVTAPDEEIWYSPVTPLELAGKWSTRTFPERKGAAAAIVSAGAKELLDPETFLTREIFGYTPAEAPFSFSDGVKAMAESTTMKELVSGVKDVPAGLVRKVSVPKAHNWRRVTESKWVKDLIAVQEQKIPGFAKWYAANPKTRKQQVPHLSGAAKTAFLAEMTSHEWASTILLACQDRALLGAKRNKSLLPSRATVTKLSSAIDAVACYCSVYTQYLVRLIVDGALPKENDSGDLELFVYTVSDDDIVVTSEKLWKRLADAAGYGNRVRFLP